MRFEPTEEQALLERETSRFAQAVLAPGVREREAAGAIPHDIIRALGEQGLLGVNIASGYGGAEAGVLAYARVIRAIARVDAAVAVTMAVTNMVGEVICQFGTDEQRERYVPKLTSGEFFAGAFALSETGSGSDAASIKTRAERTDEGWVLNGEKMWITSGDDAGVMVVWAKTGAPDSKHVTCFLVEKGAAGLSTGKPEHKMGLKSSHTVALSLNDVRVGDDAVLGEIGKGFRIAMVALDGGRIGVSSQALGIGWAAFDAATRYASERKQFGKTLTDQQAIQFKLADMATSLEASWLLTLRAAAMKELGGVGFTREASMAKVFSTEAANRVVREAVQIHGGYGYTEEFAVARHYRDARVTQIYEGTSEIQRIVIAREVLREASLST